MPIYDGSNRGIVIGMFALFPDGKLLRLVNRKYRIRSSGKSITDRGKACFRTFEISWFALYLAPVFDGDHHSVGPSLAAG